MSNDTTQIPADVREQIKAAIRDVRYVAKADGAYLYEPSVDETVDRILSLLRTPRGEGKAQPWRKVGEDPPPNGVQVLAYDPRPDGYSYAGCWAYTLIRKGDEYYLDGERCDEEDRSRLRIEEWLWQPLPPYPGSRSKDDDVRDAALLRTPRGGGEASGLAECIITCMGCGQDFDADDDAQSRYHEAACEVVDHEPARVEIARRLRGAALRSGAQWEEGPVAWLVERRGVEMFGWHTVYVCLGRQNAENIARVMRDGEWDVRVVPLYRAALRSEAPGDDRWEDVVFGPITEAYNEAHAARRSDAQEGEEDALVCASCGEPIGDEPTVIWQDAYTHYRCTPEDAIRDDTPVIRPIDTARRGEGGGDG